MAESKKPPAQRPEDRFPTNEADHPEQYQRFLEAAREHGCEENAGRVDGVVRRAAKMPPPRQEPPKPKKGRKARP